MALLRKLFARKAMDGLSHVSERVFVFNSCLSTQALDGDARRDYLTSTVIQLNCCHPHGSLMVLNFADAADETAGGSGRGAAVDSLLRHGAAAVVHYPSRYAGCPSLPLSEVRAFLGSSVEWLVSDRQRNVLLMHCEGRAAWPALAFAMASLLAYIEEPAPEHVTLDAVYARAPMELLAAGSALDPRPSHLRYLRYVTRLRGAPHKGLRQEPFLLDCLILRAVPGFDGNGGCTPVVRVHGRKPQTDALPEVMFSTPRIKQHFKQYKQAESAVIKANIECQIQGDIVIECFHVGAQDREEIMFRVMFSTCFLQSNMMVFALDDLDLPWSCSREKFQEDFKIEVFFSEVELSDTDESGDESEPSSLGNADEFYDFDEILIDSDFHRTEQEWHGENSRQNHDQEEDINTEEGETRILDGSSSSSSEEKGSISNSSSDDDAEFIHGPHLSTEMKGPRSGEASYLLEVGSSSDMQLQPVAPTRKDLNIEMSSSGQENRGVTEEITQHQGAETSMQKGVQVVIRSVPEVNNIKAGHGALNPQVMRKTRQKQATIIPPVPTIRKKVRKPENGSDDKKPAIGKMLLKVASQKGAPGASSSSKNYASEAKATSSTHKQHQIANRLKQGTAQARGSSNLSKEHLKNSATATTAATEIKQATLTLRTPPSSPSSPLGQQLNQEDSKGSRNPFETTKKSTAHSSIKQATFTLRTPPSSPPSPLGQQLNQEDSKGSHNPFETTKKSTAHSSIKPRARLTPKQEATTVSNVKAPDRKTVLKKSLSSPAISQTGMTSLPGVKTAHPRSSLPVVASTTSPRARKQGTPLPSSPRRSPLVSSKVVGAILAAQPDMHQSTSAPVRLPRRASFSELSHSLASTSVSNERSLSPRTSRVIQQNHQAGMKGSSRSSSPLSPRLTRAQPSPKSTATVSISDSKGSNTSGAAPARLTRLSS